MNETVKINGRPRKEFDEKDWKILDGNIIWGTSKYCSDKLNVSEDTLSRRILEYYGITFAELKDQKRDEVRNNLRLKQYEIAMKGNVSMLIWLGKNELGQSDKSETTHVFNKDEAKESLKNLFGSDVL